MQITIIAGARPNFMKIAPIIKAIEKAAATGKAIGYRLVHTGQHYDHQMSGSFFEQLGIPAPHTNLGAGGGTQAEQTASIMVGFEKELSLHPANLVMVVGDVTSTMACAIVAQKLCTKVAHVEAGIRSGDWTMPEEINRIVTDSITNYFFTTSHTANEQLQKQGVRQKQVFFVGNTMIDSLLAQRPSFAPPSCWQGIGLSPKKYWVLTLHRPANVDSPEQLGALMEAIIANSAGLPIVFPVHPRTRKNLEGLALAAPNLHLTDPLDYLGFNYLVEHALAVITDSGGITEEATVMGVPCMTLRNSTERPETVTLGTNELLGTDAAVLPPAMQKALAGEWKKGSIPPLWDGRAAERIVEVLLSLPEN